jgi:capsular exopolysaccharide synthesis family protein
VNEAVDRLVETPRKRAASPSGARASESVSPWNISEQPSSRSVTASVHDYLRILYRHRWLAILTFFVVTVPVALFGILQTPAYEARARLVLEPEPSAPVAFEDASRRQGQVENDARTQEEVLRSREIVLRTIIALRLWERPSIAPLTAPTLMTLAKRKVGLELPPAPVSPTAALTDEERAAPLVPIFAQRISVVAIPLSRLMDVAVEAPEGRLAADFVNGLVQQFIKADIDARALSARQSSAWLEARLEEQRRKVEADDAALQAYKEQQNALSVGDRQNIVDQKLSDLNTAVTAARTERLAREGTYRQVEQARGDATALQIVPAIASNAAIQQVRAQLDDLERQRVKLSQTFGERHPEMVRVNQAMQTTEQSLLDKVGSAADVIRNEYLNALGQEQRLQRELDSQKGDALKLNKQGLEYGRLQREAESSRQIYNALLQQTRQGDIAGLYKQSPIRILEPATRPFSPIRPARAKFALLAVTLGLFGAVGLAFAREMTDSRIKTPQQIQDYLQLPFVGLIPATAPGDGEERPTFTDVPPTPFAEALRRVRANLRLAAPGPEPQVLLVTSAAPQEGKTTVCVGLAQCFAIATTRVLVIDADLRRPTVHRTLHLKHAKGLAEYLSGKCEADEVVQATTFENLSVITAGTVPGNPSELLGLPRMSALLDAMRQRFDWILIDTAPVLSAPDAEQVATLASGILFIVCAEMTPRDRVLRAEQQLMRARVPFAGSVLNRAKIERHGYYYAPYYNKAYESYYEPRE